MQTTIFLVWKTPDLGHRHDCDTQARASMSRHRIVTMADHHHWASYYATQWAPFIRCHHLPHVACRCHDLHILEKPHAIVYLSQTFACLRQLDVSPTASFTVFDRFQSLISLADAHN